MSMEMQTYLQQAHQSLQMQHVRFSQMCKMTALFLNQDCKSLSFVNKKRGRNKVAGLENFWISEWKLQGIHYDLIRGNHGMVQGISKD